MKRLNLVLLLVGLAFLVVAIVKVGPATLAHGATALGWTFVLVVANNFLWYAADAWGWALVLIPGRLRAGELGRLVLAYVVGETMNNTLPLLGGEPMKGVLAAEYAPAERVMTSLVVHNTIRGLAQIVLLAVGVGCSFLLLDLPGRVRTGLLVAFAAVLVGLAVVAWLQRRGLTGWLLAAAVRLHLPIRRLPERRAAAARVDAAILEFYRGQRGRFLAAFALHVVARLIKILDVLLILALLGHPVTVLQALTIQTVAVLITLVFTFIPLALGVSEGSHWFLFAAMKLDPALGVTFSLVRRVRGLIWIGLGLGLGALMSRRRPAQAGSVSLSSRGAIGDNGPADSGGAPSP